MERQYSERELDSEISKIEKEYGLQIHMLNSHWSVVKARQIYLEIGGDDSPEARERKRRLERIINFNMSSE